MFKRLAAAVTLAALLLASPAFADNPTVVREGQQFIANIYTGTAGYPSAYAVYGVDATVIQHELRTDAIGNLVNTPNIPWTIQNPGISLATVAGGVWLKGNPVNVTGMKSFMLAVSVPAADTDSVSVKFIVVGKQTANGADGLDAMFYSDSTSMGPKGWVFCNNATTLANANLIVGDCVTTTNWKVNGKNGTGPLNGIEAIPPQTTVFFNVVNRTFGPPSGFNYINVWAFNMRRIAQTSLTVDLWMKPN